MLDVRPMLFEDFRLIEMDEATGKPFQGVDFNLLPRDGGLPNCFTAYWLDFTNVQAIYGIVQASDRLEMVMAVSSWIRKHHPVAMIRTAMREVPKVIDEVGSDDIWASAPDGYDYVPRWLGFLNFEPTGQRTADNQSDWWRWVRPL